MEKTYIFGVTGVLSIFISAYFFLSNFLWLAGLFMILLLLIVRGLLGEITQKTEKLFPRLITGITIITILIIIIYKQ